MLENDRTEKFEKIDVNKKSTSKNVIFVTIGMF